MKAIVVQRTGGPEVLEVAEKERPEPGPGQALVHNSAVGVNFIDVYFRKGTYASETPYTPGTEGAGVVEAVGDGVREVKRGDRVTYAAGLGAYAEYTIVPADKLVPLPPGIDDAVACATMIQGLTAQYLSHSTYPIQNGDDVLIHAAAGGVGGLLVQMAKMRGARVIATAGGDEKVQLAKDAGADDVIDYKTTSDFAAEVKRLTGGVGVSCVYDSVGKDTFAGSLDALRPRGYLVLFGQSSGVVSPVEPQTLAQKGSLFLTRPTLVHYTRTRAELIARAQAVFDMIVKNGLKIRVAHEYPLTEAPQAHRDLEARATTGKIVLRP